MERKIGEIFECNGEWYQCVKGDMYDYCKGCPSFENLRCTTLYGNHDCWLKATCEKLEKVGKPYMHFGRIVQRYKGVTTPVERPDEPYMIYYGGSHEIDIEIKNQENMEENKLNLKPFDLEAARSGKPVCTRDGRKARIICFDKKGAFPIIALVDRPDGKEELVYTYDNRGKCGMSYSIESSEDLMMLPEKHEGWINVFNHGNNDTYVCNMIFATKELAENAVKHMNGVKHFATIKIEWEE